MASENLSLSAASIATPPDVDRLLRKITWRLWRAAIAGAFVATVSVMVVAVVGAPIYVPEVDPSKALLFFAGFGPALFTIAAAAGFGVGRRFVSRNFGWLRAGSAPARRDLERVAATPRTTATIVAGFWLVFALSGFWLLSLWVREPLVEGTVGNAVALAAYGTFVAAGGTFLLCERVVRPLLSEILPSDGDEWPKTLGVTGRLLFAWLIVSGAPVSMIAFNVGRLSPEQLSDIGRPVVVACIIVVIVGLMALVIAGQAITGPLQRLRRALRRVGSGDLDAHLSAIDPGELGLLQAGFNQMVDGLRERERMREVFGRHVGSDVARLAMETDFTSGGHKCEASAMFVDIVGSTALAERSDPDDVVETLNSFFETVVRIVTSEGGLVNKFQGDGALCVFGAPVEQPDHAARALRAARSLAEDLSNMGGTRAAIGVSSGTVVASNVGTSDRYEFTVIGDPVNEASRLTDEAKLHPSLVLVSERTIHAAGDATRGWIRGEAIALRGRSQPTITYSPYD